jgi:release factor glutamine methyltransferase
VGALPRVLDLGTGSGAIALALAHAYPSARYIATDASPEALAIAKQNAALLGLTDRISFALGDWYTALKLSNGSNTPFDLILSNPPYIEVGDPHLQQGDLRFEPASALTDHASGLSCLETIIKGAPAHLKPGGLIAVEHGFDQSDAVQAMLLSAGFEAITPYRDLAGHWRAASARKPS